MSSTATVFIDEVEVTGFALEGSSTRALNRPSVAQIRLPMSQAIGGVGSLVKIYFDGVLHHHGRVLLCETTADVNTGYTVYNSTDPLELWKWRPVRDSTGNFALPGTTDNIHSDLTNLDGAFGTSAGPQMIGAILANSQNPGGIPNDAEGPLFLTEGTIATGGVDLSGAPVDWPMTMAQLATLLVSTGEVDIIITPTELTDSTYTCDGDTIYNYGQIDVYNGRFGTNLTATVAFQYGMGLHNVRALRWNQNMTNMTNKLWYYLGPRCGPEHWNANIVGTAGDAFWDVCGNGDPDQEQQWRDWHDNVVAAAGTNCGSLTPPDSRGLYGVRMDIKIYDGSADDPDCTEGAVSSFCFYKKLWLEEAWLRLQPQEIIHITPTRDTEIGTFDIGDLVLVEAVSDVRGGFSGAQRVYEYTLSWDQDSVVALSELQVSPDNEGFD